MKAERHFRKQITKQKPKQIQKPGFNNSQNKCEQSKISQHLFNIYSYVLKIIKNFTSTRRKHKAD